MFLWLHCLSFLHPCPAFTKPMIFKIELEIVSARLLGAHALHADAYASGMVVKDGIAS